MSNNIDQLADRRTVAGRTPADKLRDSFLDDRPISQWPPYLDEMAVDIQAGIGIGDTNLDKFNFPDEVGPLYQRGMVATAGEHSDLPDVVENELTGKSLGQLVYLLNQLRHNISHSETGLEDIQRAITAVLEKLLTDAHGRTNPRLGGGANSTADILMQLFSDPEIAEQAEDILDRFEETYDKGLLAKLDEPQMMTPLWEHQRDALDTWAESGHRGYADMATATGKTVLGLSAVALRYGGLHPFDEDIDEQAISTNDRKAEVLIVAHNDLILEQWRREFDRHLNIPEDRTGGSDDVELTWGRIHFRTAQALLNRDHINYDLVVLDEAHHYANGSGWGQLLDSFQNDVLALSGSVDEGKEADSKLRERFESTIGPEVKHYNITDAQRDGVIPTFDWHVKYAPTGDVGSEFVEITEKAAARFRQFQEQLEADNFDLETDRRLRTHEDVRRFSHTSEGKQLKRDDEDFKELVTTLFSRRTQRWNQSPELDAVVDTIQRFSERKVVVLTNNNAQIDRLEELLSTRSDVPSDRVFTVYGADSSSTQRDTVDAFDEPGKQGVLIGTGGLIGEGVDMQHVEVGINMSTGNVNKQLIQRIGRVLRNPKGDKRATFVNLVGIPARREAQIPAEDGQRLIEDAQQFVAFGDRFDNAPIFDVSSPTVAEATERLLTSGYERITSLDDDGVYDWPDGEQHREQLHDLLAEIDTEREAGSGGILAAWSPASQEMDTGGPDSTQKGETDTSATTTSTNQRGGSTTELELSVTGVDERAVTDAFVSVVGTEQAVHGRTDEAGRVVFELATDTCTIAVRHSAAGLAVMELDSLPSKSRQTITLPDAEDE